MIALPIIAFAGLFVLLLRKSPLSRRVCFMWASLIWSLIAVMLVEGLSVFSLLTKLGVAVGWAAVIAAVAVTFVLFKDDAVRDQGFSKTRFSLLEAAALASVCGIVLLTALTALVAAPNNWDSMTYHLPRVMHWIQNQSVAYYPTHILRQLYQPPGAEYVILHFQILSGGDRFANMVQWFSMLSSLLVLSMISRQLGGGRLTQILTALFAATIPMGILQASSTQNDYTAGYWLAMAVYFLLRLMQPVVSGADRCAAGLACGLALLTKGTNYIFLFPFGIWWLVQAVRMRKKAAWKDVVVIAALCVLINGGFFLRNYLLFGKPLSGGRETYVNEGFIPSALASNALRNLTLHIGAPSARVNEITKNLVERLHAAVGLNANDSKTTWDTYEIRVPTISEELAGNPLHLFLAFAAGLMAVLRLGPRREPAIAGYALSTAAAFLLFCAVFKWQLFHSRLHLPLFLLGSVLAGWALERMTRRHLAAVVVSVAVLLSLFPLLRNERRPLLAQKNIFNTSRTEQYFFYRKFMILPYVLAVESAASRGYQDVGLVLSNDEWEYPLWVLFGQRAPGMRLYHVGVKNDSAGLGSAAREDIRGLISVQEDAANVLIIDGDPFVRVRQVMFMNVYEKLLKH